MTSKWKTSWGVVRTGQIIYLLPGFLRKGGVRWMSLPKIYGVDRHATNMTRCWQLKYFLCPPRTLGKWSNLTNIFQRGWNHHLEYIVGAPYNNSTSNDRLKGGFHLERSSRKTFNKELRRHREPPVALDGRCGGKHNSGWRIIPDRK